MTALALALAFLFLGLTADRAGADPACSSNALLGRTPKGWRVLGSTPLGPANPGAKKFNIPDFDVECPAPFARAKITIDVMATVNGVNQKIGTIDAELPANCNRMTATFTVDPAFKSLCEWFEFHWVQIIPADGCPAKIAGTEATLPVVDTPANGWDYMYTDNDVPPDGIQADERVPGNVNDPNWKDDAVDTLPWYHTKDEEKRDFKICKTYPIGDVPADCANGKATKFETYLIARPKNEMKICLLAGFKWSVSVALDEGPVALALGAGNATTVANGLMNGNIAGWTVDHACDLKCVTKEEKKCIETVNKAAAKVASTQGKENIRCVRNAGKGTLPGTAQQCLTADEKGKVSKAKAKTIDQEAKRCTTAPSFGFSGAAIANAAAQDESVALIGDIIGHPVDGALASCDEDPVACRCQATVVKGYEKLAATQMGNFLRCKKLALKNGVASAAGLEACVGDDSKGKAAKAIAKLGGDIAAKCAGVNTCAAFAGSCSCLVGNELRDCIARQVTSRTCRMINAIDGLAAECCPPDFPFSCNGTCCDACGTTDGVYSLSVCFSQEDSPQCKLDDGAVVTWFDRSVQSFGNSPISGGQGCTSGPSVATHRLIDETETSCTLLVEGPASSTHCTAASCSPACTMVSSRCFRVEQLPDGSFPTFSPVNGTCF